MAYKLSVGVITPMLQNVVYALPHYKCTIFTDGTTPTIQQSNTEAFTANVAATLTGGQSDVSGAFIRCTTGNINVFVKRA